MGIQIKIENKQYIYIYVCVYEFVRLLNESLLWDLSEGFIKNIMHAACKLCNSVHVNALH